MVGAAIAFRDPSSARKITEQPARVSFASDTYKRFQSDLRNGLPQVHSAFGIAVRLEMARKNWLGRVIPRLLSETALDSSFAPARTPAVDFSTVLE